MTKPKARAWLQCACGRNMRATNKHGKCGRCRQADLNAERCRARYRRLNNPAPAWRRSSGMATEKQVALSVELASEAIEQARDHGHTITAMVQDTEPASWIGRCEKCDGFVVVDMIESGTPYGMAYLTKCRGIPLSTPAPRRSEHDYVNASTSASNERADNHPPDLAPGLAVIPPRRARFDSRWRAR